MLIATASLFSTTTFSAETKLEKAETIKNQTLDKASQTINSGKDKVCETYNDKGECISDKIGHSA